MVKWITVLLVEPGKTPDIREMPNNLKAFELIIGGYPEIVESIRPGCFILYNGVQTIPQKPQSRADIMDAFIITRVDPPELVSLNQEDINNLSQVYQ